MKRIGFSVFAAILLIVSILSAIPAPAEPDDKTQTTLLSTAESTTVPSTESVAAPTTEDTTTPTTLPPTETTAAPTTEATTVPTTMPITEPSSEPPTETTVPPTTEPETEPATQPPTETTAPPATEPQTEPPTEPETQPPTTEPDVESYSSDPRVVAFIEARIDSWTCPLRDEFGEITGSRTFASSRSGGKRAHAGLDFVAPRGTKVYAITSGTVRRVAEFYQGTLAVEVVNDDGSILRYCEIATSLKAGDRVEQGDVIGTIKRARSGTEMLHMEVYYGDAEGALTQTGNTTYTYLDCNKKFMRRSDLLDPTFLKDLKIP